MKKVLSLLIVLLMCVSLVACGSNEDTPSTDDQNSTIQSGQQNSDTKDDEKQYEADASLPGVVRINLDNVQYCVDAPSKQIYNRGPMFVNMENYFVIYDQYKEPSSMLNYDVDISKIYDASNVIEGMEKQFINACEEGLINADEYAFSITKKEDKTINGYKMSRFEGTFELKYEIDNPDVDYTSTTFTGYSLIKDGCPVYFVVVDVPSAGGVDDVSTMADKIAKTFREYSED